MVWPSDEYGTELRCNSALAPEHMMRPPKGLQDSHRRKIPPFWGGLAKSGVASSSHRFGARYAGRGAQQRNEGITLETRKFDQMAVAMARGSSRRKVLAGLAVGLLGVGLGRSSVQAAKVKCPADPADCQAIAPGGGEASCLRSTGTCEGGFCVYNRVGTCLDKTKNVCCGLGSRKAGMCQANAKACTG